MHFYGTYAMARVAGIPSQDAYIIAYSAQFVDDSNEKNGDVGTDNSMMFGIATTHHLKQSVVGAASKRWYESLGDSRAAVMQRQIWVPFHFLPGGQGDTLKEKMVCIIDSQIAQEMIEHHIEVALSTKTYGLHSLGVAAHVYMDTFAHYGFVGEGSKMNDIDNNSLDFEKCKNPESDDYLEDKKFDFLKSMVGEKRFKFVVSKGAELASGNLGHGAVSTYPDKPYLKWSFNFSQERNDGSHVSERNNQETYMQGCKRLHEYFTKFCNTYYQGAHKSKPFNTIEEKVAEILAFENGKDERSAKWQEALQQGVFCDPDSKDNNLAYDPDTWERERDNLENLDSQAMVEMNIYKFHQAAALHRWFVLKDLLPRHGICIL